MIWAVATGCYGLTMDDVYDNYETPFKRLAPLMVWPWAIRNDHNHFITDLNGSIL